VLVDTPIDNVLMLVKAAAAAGRLGPGRNFYVGNGTAQHGQRAASNTTNRGLSPSDPLATIAYALTQCTAGRGDNIICLQGHAESVSTAGFITVGTTDVTFLGLGRGTRRPTLTWTATAGTILHTVTTGAGATWINFYFDLAGIDAVTVGLTCAAANVTFEDCRFNTSTTAIIALKGMSLAATANNFTMKRCEVGAGVTTANTTTFLEIVGTDGLTLIDNRFVGYFTTSLGPISNITTLMSNIYFKGNLFANRTASSTVCIDCASLVSTGYIVDNRFFVTLNSDVNGFAGASATIQFSENYITNDSLETGLVMGTVSG
jgi:hypothetical protein